jgi:hypothetical protein
MKKAILFSVMASIFLFSCRKDHSVTKPTQKTYQVNFTVSGFTEQILGSAPGKPHVNSLKTDAVTGLAASIDLLYYYVYDSNGAQVSFVAQDSTSSNFGTIADHLQAGTYTVVFVGGKTGLNMNNGSKLGTASIEGYVPSYVPWGDTFFQKFQLTVSTGDVNQSVSLSRIVGELSVDILDKLPTNASSIAITVSQEYQLFGFDIQAPYGTASDYTFTYPLSASALGTSNYKKSIIMINTITPFTVTIICYDVSKKIIAQSVITNVSLQANTQTILTGNLFAADNGFNIGLNQGWDPTSINFQF